MPLDVTRTGLRPGTETLCVCVCVCVCVVSIKWSSGLFITVAVKGGDSHAGLVYVNLLN